jgi:rhamnosyltransferase
MHESRTYSVIIPTLNAARDWPRFAPALLACGPAERVLIVDSESTDGTQELARAAGFRLVTVARRHFNHGGTRQWAIQFAEDAEILVFLTQDAVLAQPDSLSKLLAAFGDPAVGAAFGRQLARPEAGPIERHARLFNYPPESSVRSFETRDRLGFKTIFLSNSFAAYRRTALEGVGGFPTDVIFGEDTVTAARLLKAGWKIHYVAEAEAYHSHDYTARQEFRRYFDIGVLHVREGWLQEEFGRTGGEGKRFVLSELRYLWRHGAGLIPSAVARTLAKWAGYQLGRREGRLSVGAKRRLSMHRGFWER